MGQYMILRIFCMLHLTLQLLKLFLHAFLLMWLLWLLSAWYSPSIWFQNQPFAATCTFVSWLVRSWTVSWKKKYTNQWSNYLMGTVQKTSACRVALNCTYHTCFLSCATTFSRSSFSLVILAIAASFCLLLFFYMASESVFCCCAAASWPVSFRTVPCIKKNVISCSTTNR